MRPDVIYMQLTRQIEVCRMLQDDVMEYRGSQTFSVHGTISIAVLFLQHL